MPFHRLLAKIVAVSGAFFVPAIHAAAPRVTHIFPAGVARGSSVVLTASGEFSLWPTQVWSSDPGIKVEPDADKGKLKLSAAADIAPGVYWLRCYDGEGVSSPRPIVVGMLPEVEEAEPNDSPQKSQIIPERITINGRLNRNGDEDCFAVSLRAGQTLIADLQANRVLGSPMDAVLQVCWLGGEPAASGPADAFVMQQNDDTVGIDPRLVYSVPRDGKYLVRVFAFPQVPTATIGFAGGDNFIYRLTLTTGGFIDFARPLAVMTGSATEFELCGWNIPPSLRKVVQIGGAARATQFLFHPDLASQAQVNVVQTSVVDYRNPGDAAAYPVFVPVVVTGLLTATRQRDEFVFPAIQGKKYRLRVDSRSLGFDADPVLQVTDANRKQLEEIDDVRSRRDPELVFTAPTDGQYHAIVRDVHGQGSRRHTYRLTIDEAAPDFAITVAKDSFLVMAGKSVEIPVAIERREGFAETIDIQAHGLPPGVTATPVASEKSGSSAKAVKLVLTAGESAASFNAAFKVTGSAGAAPLSMQRVATYELNDLATARDDIWLTVATAK